jgi:preprotein translocase subunit SecA
MGLLDSFKKIVGTTDPTEILSNENDKQLKIYMQKVEQINAVEDEFEKYSDEQLKTKTLEFKQRFLGNL